MTEEEKVEKKVAAETKKKLKDQALATNARHVDLSTLPQSSYLKKRAEFRQKRRCKTEGRKISENSTLHSDQEDETLNLTDSDSEDESHNR